MSCSRWQDWLLEYAEARLGAEEKTQVEQHIATCPACRREAEELAWVIHRLKADPGEEPEPAFLQRLLRQVPEYTTASRWSSSLRLFQPLWQPRLALVVLLLTLLLFYPLYRLLQRPSSVAIPPEAVVELYCAGYQMPVDLSLLSTAGLEEVAAWLVPEAAALEELPLEAEGYSLDDLDEEEMNYLWQILDKEGEKCLQHPLPKV